jgi:hypothetical protein
MSAARIGKITLKSGGASVRVLHQATPNKDGTENWAGALMETARTAVNHTDGESGPVVGFVVAAFYSDGSTWVDYRWGAESPINRALLPGYIAEVVRRDLLMEGEARDTFNKMFEWRE